MRWLPLIAAVVSPALLAGCAHVAHPHSARYLPLADCPVTRGDPGERPPPALKYQAPPPVPYVHDWYGNQAIWVMLPEGGQLPALPAPAPGWPARRGTKFPWYGLRPGQLRITGQRLDGPGQFAAQVGTTQEGYGPPGFVPSDLYWSGPGCWRLTATLATSTLRFTARVYLPSRTQRQSR